MVHRDPQTGQFVEDSEVYDDIEVVSFEANAGVEASNLGGATSFDGANDNFEGIEVIDYDDVVDRNEELHLLTAMHRLTVFANSTETADGTVACGVEVSASPSRTGFAQVGANVASVGNDDAVGAGFNDDTIDIIGRVLTGVGGAPFSDSATGVGGGGSAGEDQVTLENPPAEMARFHPRDELFVNGQFRVWNIDDAGVHMDLQGQHIYGVVTDE